MGKTLLLSVLLIDKTLLVCLSMTIALITGINGQCSTSDIKPLVLDASTNDEKNIYSPNYPDGYPEMSDCEWRIQAPFGYVVLLCMSFIGLDATLECNANSIGVFDGNSTDNRQLLDKFCSLQQKQLYSSSSEMLVKFTSDDSKSFMGFHFLFKAVLKSDITVSPNCTKASTFNPVQGNDSTSTAVVLGSFIAAIFLLIIFFVTFRYCLRKRSTRGSSSHPPASASNRTPTNTSTTATLRSCTLLPNSASSATLYPNNNTIFMIAPSSQSLGSTHPHNSSSGVTNLAYSSFGDRPPSYSSIQQETGQIVQSLTFVLSSAYDPPPSYSETMMKSHPPAVPLLKTTLMSPPSATINSETFRIPQPGEVLNSEDSPNSPSVLPCFPSSVYSEALRLSRPGERPYSVDGLHSEDISLSPLTPDLESVIAQTQSTNAESLSVVTQNSESVIFDNHSPASTNSESVTSDSLVNNLNSLLLRSQTHSPTTVNSESVTHPLADRCSEA